MSIAYRDAEKMFLLETKNSSYRIKIDEIGRLLHLYYGHTLGTADAKIHFFEKNRGFSGNPYELGNAEGKSLDTVPQEYSCYGTGDYRISSLMVEDEYGSLGLDLRFKEYKISDGKYRLEGLPYVRDQADHVQTLEIVLMDKDSEIQVTLLYGVYEDKDIITRTAKIFNASAGERKIHKAASMCLDFPYQSFDLIHFSGRHCMERKPEREPLTQDIITVGSKRGMSSHHNNPYVILCDRSAGEDQGNCYGFMLMYSGNHKEEVEKDQSGSVRIVMGIHEEGFLWGLEPGAEFQTPESILAYSAQGLNGLSQLYHRIIRENVCDPKYLNEKRPVLLNSWEAAYFDFDDEKLYEMAKAAKELGVELFVLDDGWFGERDDEDRGLGDWQVNEKKIKGGLHALVERINALGLKFGLWFEPEMINENSKLYQAHPDWALKEPKRMPVLSRNQLVLDMSRKDVRDCLFDQISEILKESNIEYVKWDFNRALSNVYSRLLPESRQGETAHRFILGTYELIKRITEAFPNVMIEGCAGGGGRFDAGMLFYCPQIWCSDNTDPIARLKIQKGTSYGYPVSTMGSHVSASPNHETGRTTPIHTRAVTAMSGTFGYELDPSKLTEEEKEEIRGQIEAFHRYYWLIQKGTYYRLGDENLNERACCWAFVSEEKDEILLNLVATDIEANASRSYVRLKGLKEDACYQLEGTDVVLSGAALMYHGFIFDELAGDYPAVQLHFTEA